MQVYVIIALDEDSRLKECIVVTDEYDAAVVRDRLNELGYPYVAVAHRRVDHMKALREGPQYGPDGEVLREPERG